MNCYPTKETLQVMDFPVHWASSVLPPLPLLLFLPRKHCNKMKLLSGTHLKHNFKTEICQRNFSFQEVVWVREKVKKWHVMLKTNSTHIRPRYNWEPQGAVTRMRHCLGSQKSVSTQRINKARPESRRETLLLGHESLKLTSLGKHWPPFWYDQKPDYNSRATWKNIVSSSILSAPYSC